MDPRLTNEPLIIAVHWTKTYVQSTLSWKWLSDSSRNLAIYIKSNNASWGKLQVTLSTFLATIMDVQTNSNTSTIPTITYLYQISPSSKDKKVENMYCNSNEDRLQKQSVFLRIQVRASSQTKVLERGWKQRARLGRDAKGKTDRWFFSLASHALRVCAPRARKTLTPRFTDFFTDFEKKIDCFAVYNEDGFIAYVLMSSNGKVKMIVLCTYNLAQNRWEIYTSRSHQFKDGNVAHFGFRTASSLI